MHNSWQWICDYFATALSGKMLWIARFLQLAFLQLSSHWSLRTAVLKQQCAQCHLCRAQPYTAGTCIICAVNARLLCMLQMARGEEHMAGLQEALQALVRWWQRWGRGVWGALRRWEEGQVCGMDWPGKILVANAHTIFAPAIFWLTPSFSFLGLLLAV